MAARAHPAALRHRVHLMEAAIDRAATKRGRRTAPSVSGTSQRLSIHDCRSGRRCHLAYSRAKTGGRGGDRTASPMLPFTATAAIRGWWVARGHPPGLGRSGDDGGGHARWSPTSPGDVALGCCKGRSSSLEFTDAAKGPVPFLFSARPRIYPASRLRMMRRPL